MKDKGLLAGFALLLVLTCAPLRAGPVIHKFRYWATLTEPEKIVFLNGWTNGFFAARPKGAALATCLEGLPYVQSTAMIDKYYKDHPEHWSDAIGAGILVALTENGPCEGKEPLK
jgi:hypothetical protein